MWFVPALAHAQTPTFRALLDMPAGCHATSMVTGDFDGDHKADVAVLCNGQISVILGNGDGTLQTPLITSFSNSAIHVNHVIIAADFNRDGKTDLATDADAGILVFLSTGNGKFGPPSLIPWSQDYWYIPFGAADVNGDGIIDLHTLMGNGVSLYAGHGDGTFAAPTDLQTGIDIVKTFEVADLNSDSIPDLLIATWAPAGMIYENNALVTYALLGKGGGTFAAPKLVSQVGGMTDTFGDYNGDGSIDVVLGKPIPARLDQSDQYNPYMNVLLANSDGTFRPPVTTPGFAGPFVAADFNGDGKADLAQPANTTAVAILLSQGDGFFKPIDSPPQLSGYPTQVAVADFNGDRKPDIAVMTDAGISILLNTTLFKTLGGILNAASYARNQGVAPGSLVSIFGTGFASASAQSGSIPLPTSLDSVSITFNGTPAPVSFVSASQINAEVPWSASGTVHVVVTAGGTVFSPFQLQIASMAPGIFSLQSGAGQAIAINPDGSLAGSEGSVPGLSVHPAREGDPIVIFGTGLGAVKPSISDGAASSDTLRTAVNTPSVLIGGQPAQVLFAGLSPQFVGVNQINVVVPHVPAPGVVSLQITAGGTVSSDKVTIAVQNLDLGNTALVPR